MDRIISWFQATLLPFGAPGLAVLAFLDASFLPMPQLFDIAVLLAITVQPEKAVPYVIATTVGSSLGTLVVFGAARYGRTRLARSGKQSRLEWAERLIRDYGILFVAGAATLPAPFPFKYVVIAAGLLGQRWSHFGVAVVVGRAIRFGSQAVIAVWYGQAIIELFKRYALPATTALVVLIIGLYAGFRWAEKRWMQPEADDAS